MRNRTDRLIAAGTLAVVTVVPTVLVAASWGDDGKRPQTRTNAADQNPNGNGVLGANGLPTPGTTPTPSPTTSSPAIGPYGGRPAGAGRTPHDSTGSGSDSGSGSGSGSGSTSGRRDSRSPASLLPAADGARITAAKWRGDHEVDLTVRSPALGSTQKVRLLVPRSWRAKTSRTWPIVYAFHGGQDGYTSWTRSTDIEAVARRYDVIVAMPEGANGSYTDWYNHGRGGIPKWETFHVNEVRQLLERNYHAGSSRAAMGLSSGAQGAITYAARFPGLFRYVASYSGILSMLSPGIPSMLMYINSGNGADAVKIWGDPVINRANWAAHDPASLVSRLRGTGVYVSAGNGQAGPLDAKDKAVWDIGYLSESQVQRTTRDFVDRARRLGVPVTSHFYGNGSHSWPYWKREVHGNWPTIMRAIGARRV